VSTAWGLAKEQGRRRGGSTHGGSQPPTGGINARDHSHEHCKTRSVSPLFTHSLPCTALHYCLLRSLAGTTPSSKSRRSTGARFGGGGTTAGSATACPAPSASRCVCNQGLPLHVRGYAAGKCPSTWFATCYLQQPASNLFCPQVLDNGVTSSEFWRILDCDEGLDW